LDVNYTFVKSLKVSEEYPGDPNVNTQLISIPEETANFALTWVAELGFIGIRRIETVLLHQFVGVRYASQDNKRELPPYNITSASFITRLGVAPFRFNIKAEVQNLFNEDYQVVLGYPMPGRTFRLTLGLEY